MTAKEAYTIFKRNNSELEAEKCFEYSDLFVFQIKRNVPDTFDAHISVNKRTGLTRDFKPFHISLEEYRNSKIVDFI